MSNSISIPPHLFKGILNNVAILISEANMYITGKNEQGSIIPVIEKDALIDCYGRCNQTIVELNNCINSLGPSSEKVHEYINAKNELQKKAYDLNKKILSLTGR